MTETEESSHVESRPVTDFSNFDQNSQMEAALGPSTVNIPRNMSINYLNTQRCKSTRNTSVRVSCYDGEDKDDEQDELDEIAQLNK